MERPTLHFKKDDRSSSESLLRHQEDSIMGAGTSGSASPEVKRANVQNSPIIVFCQSSTCPFGPLVPARNTENGFESNELQVGFCDF